MSEGSLEESTAQLHFIKLNLTLERPHNTPHFCSLPSHVLLRVLRELLPPYL